MITEQTKNQLAMGNQSKALSLSLLLTLFSLFTFCDGNGEGGKTVSINGKTKIQPIATLPVKNRVVLFIDKTSSLVNVSQEDADKGKKWLLDTIMPRIRASGAELVIYFIQKDLVSASPHYRGQAAVPNTNGLVTIKRLKANDRFKKQCDSLENKIRQAISVERRKATDTESDLFATVKKANDFLSKFPKSDKKMIFYYSDMIESVNDKNCGKNYEKIYFKTVEQAKEAGKKDAEPIKRCQSVDKLPENTSVYLIIPNGSLDLNKHKYIPEYWKALFGEFGVKKVENNL